MKNTKKALATSAVSLLLCFAMLIGTTFAWFTDKVEVTGNRIVAGNLDVELYHTNAAVADEKVTATTALFTDKLGHEFLWEPGAVIWENFTVENEGNLALKYRLDLDFENENTVNGHGLSEILKIGLVPAGVTKNTRADVIDSVQSWLDLSKTHVESKALSESSEETFGIVIYWEPSANDNLYNVNNGASTSNGQPLAIKFDILLQATQQTEEEDSFDELYDTGAYLVELPEAVIEDLTQGADSARTVSFDLGNGEASAVLPVAMKFTAPNENLNDKPYKDWNVDFVVKFSEDVKANQVVFLGYHEGHGAWVPLPLTRDVAAGEEIRVMTELFAPALGYLGYQINVPSNAGLGYDLVESFFSPFTCGVIPTTDFIEQNEALGVPKADFEDAITDGFTSMGFPGMDYSNVQSLNDGTVVTLELRMYETVDDWDFGGIENGVSYVLETYRYTLGD